MGPIEYIVALIGAMHGAIAMRMLPASGETAMSDERVKAVIADTFRLIREAHAAIIAASAETEEVRTKREASHKKYATQFVALLDNELAKAKPAQWAVMYREMTRTAKPVGGDKDTANAIQKHHDDQRKLIVEAFAVTNPYLADAEGWIPRLGTKGRPAGSRNKDKAEVPALVSPVEGDNKAAGNPADPRTDA